MIATWISAMMQGSKWMCRANAAHIRAFLTVTVEILPCLTSLYFWLSKHVVEYYFVAGAYFAYLQLFTPAIQQELIPILLPALKLANEPQRTKKVGYPTE